jgi:transcriptional regulator with XRE-family HTH domain
MTRNRDRLIDKKIGSVIRMQRVKLRMSQSDLGNSLGVTFQQIQKYENGGNAVASTGIPALCQTLEISPNDLFGVSARMDDELSQLDSWAMKTALKVQELSPAAAALEEVASVKKDYQRRIRAADPSDRNRLAGEAHNALVKAVIDRGRSVEEYTSILS